jgi:threonine synthase
MQRNDLLCGLSCLHCSTRYPLALRHDGCPQCQRRGLFVSLSANYRRQANRYRYLPYEAGLSLGEGNTPLLENDAIAKWVGVERLSLKDESCNPTGSHKDRMSAMGLSQAIEAGVHTVVLASSGNAALSAGSYAQHSGLACEVATYGKIPRGFSEAFEALGIISFNFEDNPARWAFVRSRALLEGYLALTNYALPALGSAPLAIEGYKAIAYEMYEGNCLPDHILVPTARGDLLWGIFAGFRDLLMADKIKRLPKLWLVEPFARMEQVLAQTDARSAPLPPPELHGHFKGSTAQFSTAGNTATYLQWQAVTASGGGAIAVADAEARVARQVMAELFHPVELCAGAGLAAARSLVMRGEIDPRDHVNLIVTANASRDPTWSEL